MLRLFNDVIGDLESESNWISAVQERILNDQSISLNDDENQNLMDSYYVRLSPVSTFCDYHPFLLYL